MPRCSLISFKDFIFLLLLFAKPIDKEGLGSFLPPPIKTRALNIYRGSLWELCVCVGKRGKGEIERERERTKQNIGYNFHGQEENIPFAETFQATLKLTIYGCTS